MVLSYIMTAACVMIGELQIRVWEDVGILCAMLVIAQHVLLVLQGQSPLSVRCRDVRNVSLVCWVEETALVCESLGNGSHHLV